MSTNVRIDLKDIYSKLDTVKNEIPEDSKVLINDVMFKLELLEFEINVRREFNKLLSLVNQDYVNEVARLLNNVFISDDYSKLLEYVIEYKSHHLCPNITTEEVENFIEKSK